MLSSLRGGGVQVKMGRSKKGCGKEVSMFTNAGKKMRKGVQPGMSFAHKDMTTKALI